jgi:hypothetical protein
MSRPTRGPGFEESPTPPQSIGNLQSIYLFLSGHRLFGFTRPRKVLWGSKIAKDPPFVLYDEVVSSEYGVYKWLSKIVSRTPPIYTRHAFLLIFTPRIR